MRNFWAALLLIFSLQSAASEAPFQGRLASLLAEEIVFTGPNCFNSALRLLGVQTQRRHLLETEMEFILKNSCQRASRRSGTTLGILRSPLDGKPLHGFVPLEDGLVFTKNGFSKRARNEIQTEKQMIALHTAAVRKACPPEAEFCVPLTVEYYSCGPLPSFPLEDLMTEAQGSRETAFDENFQRLFEAEFEALLRQDLSGLRCEARRQALSSLLMSWTLINYASITPEESSRVEHLVSRLSALSPPACPR